MQNVGIAIDVWTFMLYTSLNKVNANKLVVKWE